MLKSKFEGLRCIHRHTILEHPKCFMTGKIKETKKVAFPDAWYNQPEIKIGFLDIETDNLKADFGTMLTWCIKELNGTVYYDTVTKDELFGGSSDTRIIKSCIDKLNTLDVVVGYYSKRFDVPFLRTKALHYGLAFPDFTELYHWDLYDSVKSKLCLSRRSLESACDFLGIKGKTPIDKEVWRLAKYGDKKAIGEVLEHNIADVIISEELYKKLEFTRKWIKSAI